MLDFLISFDIMVLVKESLSIRKENEKMTIQIIDKKTFVGFTESELFILYKSFENETLTAYEKGIVTKLQKRMKFAYARTERNNHFTKK